MVILQIVDVAMVILSHFEQGTIGVFIIEHANWSCDVRSCPPYRSGYIASPPGHSQILSHSRGHVAVR